MQPTPCGNESVKITFPTLLHGAHLSDDEIKVLENAIAQMVCLVLSIPLFLSPHRVVQEHWNSLVSSPGDKQSEPKVGSKIDALSKQENIASIVSSIRLAVQDEQCLAIDNKVYHYLRSSSYLVLI